ncbi:hypothetical protein [Cryobacterium sp. Y11]|uniref:hypothetical protein n=1 Tax=Cryobacterium sp. Y11 TaxID=2045016 RepID=UPI001E2C8347|nr:hypothetical protein [Cryobacterium sp. Y11]
MLSEHRGAVIVIGAQTIYLHTGNALVALADATKDSDFALDPRRLDDDPLREEAMTRAGFHLNTYNGQPGEWMNRAGTPSCRDRVTLPTNRLRNVPSVTAAPRAVVNNKSGLLIENYVSVLEAT